MRSASITVLLERRSPCQAPRVSAVYAGPRLLPLRPELPPADAVKVQVEDRLAGIVARVAGEPIAGRLHAHLAGDPSRHRNQPTEGRLVPRLGLSGRRKMLLRDDEEVDRCDPDRVVLRKVEGDHEVIFVEDLRPKLAADDLA